MIRLKPEKGVGGMGQRGVDARMQRHHRIVSTPAVFTITYSICKHRKTPSYPPKTWHLALCMLRRNGRSNIFSCTVAPTNTNTTRLRRRANNHHESFVCMPIYLTACITNSQSDRSAAFEALLHSESQLPAGSLCPGSRFAWSCMRPAQPGGCIR